MNSKLIIKAIRAVEKKIGHDVEIVNINVLEHIGRVCIQTKSIQNKATGYIYDVNNHSVTTVLSLEEL